MLKGVYSDRFTALMRFQAERAHRLCDRLRVGLVPDPIVAQLGIVGVLLPLRVEPLAIVFTSNRSERGPNLPVRPGDVLADLFLAFDLLREIEAEHFQVLHQRIALTPLRKFWLAWKMQALGRF